MKRKRPLRITRGSRRVFFVTVSYDGWDAQDIRADNLQAEFVVTSRRQAKKAIAYIRARSIVVNFTSVDSAWQADLFYTGWKPDHRSCAGRRAMAVALLADQARARSLRDNPVYHVLP